jgi:hypothetical protein
MVGKYMQHLRTISESPLFSQQLEEFGDAKFTDGLIDQVKDKLAKDAEYFPELIPRSNIRHVKTVEYHKDGRKIPPLKIWFTILDADRVLITGFSRVSFFDEEFDEYITD